MLSTHPVYFPGKTCTTGYIFWDHRSIKYNNSCFVVWLGIHYMYYCKFWKIDAAAAEEKGMTNNEFIWEGLKLAFCRGGMVNRPK